MPLTTQTQERMCCIIAKMENARAGSLQEEISRGMVTRVGRDYNALQRPLKVNKKIENTNTPSMQIQINGGGTRVNHRD